MEKKKQDDDFIRPSPNPRTKMLHKEGMNLNLIYRAELLRDRRRKLGHERIEIGYHIFVTLQDLHCR